MPLLSGSELEVARKDLIYRVTGRRIATIGFFILAVPAALIGFWVTDSDLGAIVGAAVCASVAMAFGFALTLTRCPQCRSLLFMGKTGWINVWASRCLNCGLSLSTWPQNPGEQQTETRAAPDNDEMQRSRQS